MDENAHTLPLEFRGSAREYFRIWAVNLCLTLATLGVYSAWAKVRKKRYFYAHTRLDGTPFQYLARPLPILAGRAIAVALFALYYVTSHLYTVALPAVLALGLVLAPWVVVRSAAFNARYSAWRNMTFRFDGDYRGAAATLYWLGLVPLLVAGTALDWGENLWAAGAAYGLFGLVLPWWMRRLKGFIVEGTGFGGRHGEFSATGGQFMRIYFFSGAILVAAAAATAGAGGALFASGRMPAAVSVVAFMVPLYAGYVLAFAYVQAHSGNLVWNSSRLGPLRFRSTLSGRGLAGLYLGNALAILASLGLLIPWAVIRTLRYRAEHMRVEAHGELESFRGDERTAVAAAGAEVGEIFDVDLSL